MELLSWSMNAIDRVFSTRRAGSGEPTCPDGTFMSGYVMDGWGKWRVICLAALDVEDVEDVYMFTFMTIGTIALGFGIFMQYWKMRKIATEQTSARADNANTRSAVVGIRSDISTIRDFVIQMRVDVATNREDMAKLAAIKAAEETDE